MEKYEQFDISMAKIKKIEKELIELGNKENISLKQIMELREEATKHYKICNDILKELKDDTKQSND